MAGIRRDEDRLREVMRAMATYGGVDEPKPVQDTPLFGEGFRISCDESGVHMSGPVSDETYSELVRARFAYNSVYAGGSKQRRKPLWQRLLWWAITTDE